MDYTPPAQETFPDMETNRWMSEGEMSRLVGNIVTTGGYAGRTGRSTTFEVRKQVDANLVSLTMTVKPMNVLVMGSIQPGLKDLFKAEDWDVIKNLTPDGPESYQFYFGNLPRHITVASGGGYKPYFELSVTDMDTLLFFVWLVFKVAV